MIGYVLAVVPIFIFVYLPISHMIYGTSNEPLQPHFTAFNSSLFASNEPVTCPSHSYNAYILSNEPLIVYLENFLTGEESEHLLDISESKWAPSTIYAGTEKSVNKTVRFSEVAEIERDDVVRCIEHRARDFQGWRPDIHIELLKTQRYGVGGHYSHHYDWSGSSRLFGRVSTFMVYVDAQCKGGGTEFPRLKMPNTENGRWCDFLECDDSIKNNETMGITFKPIKGNAVFWENIKSDGRGYEETWHAGMPVKSGSKVGLNIWSWGSTRRT